ncbi:hypothetical protein V3391_16230 [Luteimonas sp. SMYT11W]|uniref:TRAM domain-containing protein n=1 Tax=Luteimonas flava TaxID=3115822 RepID=A0ABU7WKP3_9GAMM
MTLYRDRALNARGETLDGPMGAGSEAEVGETMIVEVLRVTEGAGRCRLHRRIRPEGSP